MTTDNRSLFLDEEVTPAVLSVLRRARKFAIVVTPYIKLWPLAQQAIQEAIQRPVKVTFYIRQDPEDIEKASEHIVWLLQHKVAINTVPNLHAKVYLNESTVIVSSMNLLSSSSQASREFALLVKDKATSEALRAWVGESLNNAGEPLDRWLKGLREGTPPSEPSAGAVVMGFCIRGREPIPFNPVKPRPLCQDHYETWAEWSDPDYQEKFCHRCGEPANVSFARPFCRKCFPQLFR